MKKITTAFLALLFLFLFNITTTHAQDAKAILNKVSAQLQKAPAIQANFLFEVKSSSGAVQMKNNGKLMMKGSKYKIDLGKEMIVSDGRNQWMYMPDEKEVQVSKVSHDEQSISLDKLFSGSYDKNFKMKYVGKKNFNKVNADVIELTPIKSQAFSKLHLYINPSNSHIIGGIMFDKGGSTYNYTISNLNLSQAVNESNFTFDVKKYPGVEVIDLR